MSCRPRSGQTYPPRAGAGGATHAAYPLNASRAQPVPAWVGYVCPACARQPAQRTHRMSPHPTRTHVDWVRVPRVCLATRAACPPNALRTQPVPAWGGHGLGTRGGRVGTRRGLSGTAWVRGACAWVRGTGCRVQPGYAGARCACVLVSGSVRSNLFPIAFDEGRSLGGGWWVAGLVPRRARLELSDILGGSARSSEILNALAAYSANRATTPPRCSWTGGRSCCECGGPWAARALACSRCIRSRSGRLRKHCRGLTRPLQLLLRVGGGSGSSGTRGWWPRLAARMGIRA